MVKKILIGLLIFLVIIQFFRIDFVNPEILVNNDFITIMHPNVEISAILETACYHCHSDKTVYPWISNIAPISWFLKQDIDEGKEDLNFSKWGNYSKEKREHKLQECYEEVREKKMPISNSEWLHGQEEFSNEDRQKLERWLQRFGSLEAYDTDGD